MSVIETIFQKIDTDHNGQISREEMDHVFKVFDKDGNGLITRAAWSNGFQTHFGGSEPEAELAFGSLDVDKNGTITLEQISQLFTLMDADHNGSVSREEFIQLWRKLLS